MLSKHLTLALLYSSLVSAAPALVQRQDPCQDAYNECIAAGTAEVACGCTLTACLGEDDARNRDFCSSATATLPGPTSTSIPGGCNPAHPGSCPSSYFLTSTSTSTAEPVPSSTSIPGGCNPAHPGSCPSSYFLTSTSTSTAESVPSSTSIPGGCNPAHPGSCPSSYFLTSTASVPVASASPVALASSPVPVSPSKSWTVANLTRYCVEGNAGCDYNFEVIADGKTNQCTIIRNPGSNAATESWSNQECTTGSDFLISWGYVANPAPAYAVITVVNGKELAWFGVSDVNGGEVTPSSPFGSGQYGTLPSSPVYTY